MLLLVALISTFVIFLRHVGIVIFNRLNKRDDLDFPPSPLWTSALEWLYLVIFFSGILLLVELAKFQHTPLLVLGIPLAAIVPTFQYTIRPLLLMLQREVEPLTAPLTLEVQRIIPKKIKILVYRGKLFNAYAMGAMPFFKLIVLGRPLVEKLPTPYISAIVAHEFAHIRLKHIPFLYGMSVLSIYVWALIMRQIYAIIDATTRSFVEGALIAALAGGLLGVICYAIIPGIIIHQLEIAADRFAAKVVGQEIYKQTMHSLDLLSNGKFGKGSLTHPDLSERLQKIQTKG